MTDGIDEELIQTALRICSRRSEGSQDLFEAQLVYWLSVKSFMQSGGYDEVRKRMPHISQTLAIKVANAPIQAIRALCSPDISTIRPSLGEGTISSLLDSQSEEAKSKQVLQLLSQESTK
jgi:hypothetical protein